MVQKQMQENAKQSGETDYPPGNSAVEIAARSGFGPLSSLASKVWHGDARPCVSCGQLVRRTGTECPSCGEQLSAEMIRRMQVHAGPWYVLEHVRPFPGVTCERLVRQVRRGVLTRMTIVRGPGTDHQWRFAGETPGLCKYLGVCWSCQGKVNVHQERCPTCAVLLGELSDDCSSCASKSSGRGTTIAGVESNSIRELRDVVQRTATRARPQVDTPRVGPVRTSWIAVAILVAVVGVLLVVVQMRNPILGLNSPPPPSSPSTATGP